ncbi:hypothetical protein BGZ60DRAFT_567743 [Tricladium varicosporioides]|nr:hypothetical protein BGZ60DRAFT_567743 [Hymenoscyphus varicosporioides]
MIGGAVSPRHSRRSDSTRTLGVTNPIILLKSPSHRSCFVAGFCSTTLRFRKLYLYLAARSGRIFDINMGAWDEKGANYEEKDENGIEYEKSMGYGENGEKRMSYGEKCSESQTPPPHPPVYIENPFCDPFCDPNPPPKGPDREDFPNDPSTISGQIPGAVIAVKRLKDLWYREPTFIVGDLINLESIKLGNLVVGVNRRTGERVEVPWECFFVVPFMQKCCCKLGGLSFCDCVVENYEVYKTHLPFGKVKNIQVKKEIIVPEVTEPELKTLEPVIWKPAVSKFQKSRSDTTYQHPSTGAGQQVGAILRVKQKPWYWASFGPKIQIEVGDFVKILKHCKNDSSKVKAKNLRTGAEGYLRWDAFLAVSPRRICGCESACCYCEYEDYDASMRSEAADIGYGRKEEPTREEDNSKNGKVKMRKRLRFLFTGK